ncbi:MAG: hypothetical protein IJN84_09800 [Clostridia bacterium]|nr:hypothetical protein [Clostridia bacterium]
MPTSKKRLLLEERLRDSGGEVVRSIFNKRRHAATPHPSLSAMLKA